MKNVQVAGYENKDSLFNFADTAFNMKPERRFDFKVKVIQEDLTENDDVQRYFRSLNESSVPFMVQYSDYIEKLNFLNSWGGADLADEGGNAGAGFDDRVFQADIANPGVLADIERRRDKMREEMLGELAGGGDVSVDLLKELLSDLADKLAGQADEEMELEDVDIAGNLYMFDMVHGIGCGQDDYDELDDEFEEEYEEGRGNNLEVKFDTVGSISFLEGNLLEVKYDESDMIGIKDAFVRFLFECDKKDCVTIHRRGYADVWLNCEKGARVSGTAVSRSFGNSVTVATKEIINNMTPDGGQLCVSYVRETNGAPSEMITHIVTASPARE